MHFSSVHPFFPLFHGIQTISVSLLELYYLLHNWMPLLILNINTSNVTIVGRQASLQETRCDVRLAGGFQGGWAAAACAAGPGWALLGVCHAAAPGGQHGAPQAIPPRGQVAQGLRVRPSAPGVVRRKCHMKILTFRTPMVHLWQHTVKMCVL